MLAKKTVIFAPPPTSSTPSFFFDTLPREMKKKFRKKKKGKKETSAWTAEPSPKQKASLERLHVSTPHKTREKVQLTAYPI